MEVKRKREMEVEREREREREMAVERERERDGGREREREMEVERAKRPVFFCLSIPFCLCFYYRWLDCCCCFTAAGKQLKKEAQREPLTKSPGANVRAFCVLFVGVWDKC